jgi:prepilin-type N-terminal cleavage/methylation domain-containing protein
MSRKGFTLIELLVVIAIIAILAALLMPALERARGEAVCLTCMNRQRQVFLAMAMYGGDYATYPNIGFPYHVSALPGVPRVATLGWSEYYPGILVAWPQYNTHLYPYVGVQSQGDPYKVPTPGGVTASQVPEIFHCPGKQVGYSNHGTLYFVPPYSGYCIPCGCYEFGSARNARSYYSGTMTNRDKLWLISDGVLWNRGAAASWTWDCPSTGGCAYYCYLLDPTQFPKSQAHMRNTAHMSLHANGACQRDERRRYAGMNVYGYVIPAY